MSNSHQLFSPPSKKRTKKMSVTQTYFLAHTARAKLSREAARPDHNLRLLVGHANMLDLLMLDLAHAEREQERWFNLSVSGASSVASDHHSSTTTRKHIEWADTPVIVEEPEHEHEEHWNGDAVTDSESDDGDDESDYGEDDAFFVDITPTITSTNTAVTLGRPSPVTTSKQNADAEYYYDDLSEPEEDDEDDLADLALTRTHSHSQNPPDLLSDSGEDSEEECGPPSPPQSTFDHFPETEPREGIILSSRLYSPTAKQPSSQLSAKTPTSDHDRSTFADEEYQERHRIIEAF